MPNWNKMSDDELHKRLGECEPGSIRHGEASSEVQRRQRMEQRSAARWQSLWGFIAGVGAVVVPLLMYYWSK